MTTFANLSDRKGVNSYVCQIGDDWKSSPNTRSKLPQKESDGALIQLVLLDKTNGGEQSFDVPSSLTLKNVFTDYAEKRDTSLRSLRFSFRGKPLFLSQCAKKCPDELGMKDQDIILVHDTTELSGEETKTNASGKDAKTSSDRAKAKNRSAKKAKTRSRASKKQQDLVETTEEELKIEVCIK